MDIMTISTLLLLPIIISLISIVIFVGGVAYKKKQLRILGIVNVLACLLFGIFFLIALRNFDG